MKVDSATAGRELGKVGRGPLSVLLIIIVRVNNELTAKTRHETEWHDTRP